ncbi:unnamed protein product [Rotaria sp. Silwood2]|nr:unnamed protein product [Rotaria sp. Silwood2]
MNARGVYHGLVEAQNLHLNENDGKKGENDEDDDMPAVYVYDRTKSSSEHVRRGTNTSTEKYEMTDKTNEAEAVTEYTGPSPFFKMLAMNRPELTIILFACLSCICNGGIQPAFGVVLSKVIAVFQICDHGVQERRILMYILIFIGFGILMFFTMFLQSFLFSISGETLTQRLRSRIFQTLLQQDVAYFDQPENNTGALCTRLATEASDVQGATGIRIGTMLQNVSNLGVGMILAFIYGWSLTLLMLAFVPFMIVAGFLQTYLMTGFANKDKKALEDAGKIAVETISNIRTVAQLTKEKHFGDEYCKLLEFPYRNSLKRAHVFGFLFSLTDSIMFFAQAALFSFGAWRVEQGAMTFENIMLVLNCILFGAMAVGQTASMSPDYSKAIASSKKILLLFDRVPTIDNSSSVGKKLENFDGEIVLNNLEFHYPNRREVQVLKNFNLTIEPHKQIALVGSSGCGKSTIIQLLEHFYNLTGGQILINQNELSTLNLQWWRSQIGFVSQEPILFDATIRENIAYVSFWSIACERQTRRLRETLLRSILSKEIAYFDTHKTGQLSTRLTEDVNKVHDGTGDKLGSALQFIASFIAGLILGFIKGWKLTLVILSVSPMIVVSAAIVTRITATMTSQELKSYAKAGAIAEEVLSSIRTVFSYNGAAYESKRSAKISGIRKGGFNGILIGVVWLLMFCTYALGFWYGAKLVREENFSIGGILIVFFSLITAMFGLGQAAPHLQSVAQAQGAAFTLWQIIDTLSTITINNSDGVKKEDLIGDIKFTNVNFVYPSRSDVSVLNRLSFAAQRGQTTALVGSSGCGKVNISILSRNS